MKLETIDAMDLLSFGYEKGAATSWSPFLLFLFVTTYATASLAVAMYYAHLLLENSRLQIYKERSQKEERTTTSQADPPAPQATQDGSPWQRPTRTMRASMPET